MTRAQYLDLSTRLAKDLKEWIEESHNHHGISAEELLALNQAAEVIERTTVRVAQVDPESIA